MREVIFDGREPIETQQTVLSRVATTSPPSSREAAGMSVSAERKDDLGKQGIVRFANG